MPDSISVVIVDDHAVVREGLRTLLSGQAGITVVGEAGSVRAALEVIEATTPDLVLLDLQLGPEKGVDIARALRAREADVSILVLSAHDTPRHLRAALAAGADGYLLKSVAGETLAAGIRDTVAGTTVIGHEFVPKLLEDARQGTDTRQPAITTREHEVLTLVADGLGNRDIADSLRISTRTAQKHLENLFKKFDVHDRTELVAHAFRRGVLG